MVSFFVDCSLSQVVYQSLTFSVIELLFNLT